MTHRLLEVLFAAGLMLLLVHVASSQTRVTETDMKEILRLLLEREVPRSANGENVAVLLGPNVKAGWIPEVTGLAIRHLSYDDQTRVPTYYDLSSSSIKGSVIEIALLHGNYCKKAGRRYEFRRQAGAWEPKVIGYVESTAGGGGSCAGCAVGSGATYTVDREVRNPPAVPPGNLRLTGSVGKIDCSKDAGHVRCKVELNLKFTNTTDRPLIILQPQGEYGFWHGGTSLALSEKESSTNTFVYHASAWPSIYESPMYRNLAELLDQRDPPAGVTRVLPPNASWDWDTSIMLSLREVNTCNQRVGVEIGWEEIKRRTTPLWLRVSYEMWPFNVENFKRDLGGKLQKRWQSHGLLYLEEKKGRYWHAILTSEPIEFPLTQIELAQ